MWKENPCGMTIRQLHLLLSKMTNNTLREQDLTFSQAMALLVLSDQPEKKLTLKQLEKYLQTSQPDVAGIASRLEKKGLVNGFADEQDRRIKWIKITDKGENYCQRARKDMRATENTLLNEMTTEEQEQFQLLLNKALQALQLKM